MLNAIKPLTSFFDNSITIICVEKREDLSDEKKTYIITTDFIPELVAERQFLVSDYLSLTEKVRLGVWLKDTLTL